MFFNISKLDSKLKEFLQFKSSHARSNYRNINYSRAIFATNVRVRKVKGEDGAQLPDSRDNGKVLLSMQVTSGTLPTKF